MLTVDYDKLGLQPAEHILDLGCGFGRHAFEALRRGAHVTACDMAVPELEEVQKVAGVLHDNREVPEGITCTSANGDATRLPFADNSFHRIIASEVMEHVPNDIAALEEFRRVLKPGGVVAVTVPTFLPERICWALNDNYHAPKSVGGHVRIYTRTELRAKFSGAGLEPGQHHLEHGIHSPYWWLKCAVGIDNDDHPLVKKYHQLLVWDITDNPTATRIADRVLSPLIGKSMVMYAAKPGTITAPTPLSVMQTTTTNNQETVRV